MIARYYEASDSGLIYFITNSFALIVTLSGLSMESGVAYYAALGQIPLQKLATFSLMWVLLATLITFGVIYTGLRAGLYSADISGYFTSAVCYVAGCLMVNFFTALFYSKKIFAAPNILLAMVNLLLILLLPVLIGIQQSQRYVTLYFWGFLLQGLMMLFLFYKKFGMSILELNILDKSETAKVVRYGITAFVSNLLFFLVYRIDYWFVERFCSPASLGNYIQVSKLAQTLFILPTMVASAVFPAIVDAVESRMAEKVATISRALLLIFLLVCGILVATGYWLFPFVFGTTFTEMYGSFLWLVPGILVLAMLYPITAYYAGMKRMSINIIALIIALVVIIAGNLLLTPLYGIKAAALVSSLGYLSYHCYLVYRFRKDNRIAASRFYKIKLSDIYRVRDIIFTKNKPG